MRGLKCGHDCCVTCMGACCMSCMGLGGLHHGPQWGGQLLHYPSHSAHHSTQGCIICMPDERQTPYMLVTIVRSTCLCQQHEPSC